MSTVIAKKSYQHHNLLLIDQQIFYSALADFYSVQEIQCIDKPKKMQGTPSNDGVMMFTFTIVKLKPETNGLEQKVEINRNEIKLQSKTKTPDEIGSNAT